MIPEKQEGSVVQGGFWLRFAAFSVDFFITAMTCFFLVFFLEFFSSSHFEYPMTLILTIYWLYYAIMESSPYQATVGKMLFQLIVTDMELNRISFLRASLRLFCKFFSIATIGIGFIMIACTKKKQGLHDIMTGCLVVRSGPSILDKYLQKW